MKNKMQNMPKSFLWLGHQNTTRINDINSAEIANSFKNKMYALMV